MSCSHESQETPLRMAEQLESISNCGRDRARGGYLGALSLCRCRIRFGHLSVSLCAHHSEEYTVVGKAFGDQSNFSRPSVAPEPSPPINSCVSCEAVSCEDLHTMSRSPPTVNLHLHHPAQSEATALFQPYHDNFKYPSSGSPLRWV